MSDTFCALPWIQVSIKPSGMMTTCCVMSVLTKDGVPINRETQKKIKNGELPFSRLWWENQQNTYICGKDSIFDIINADLLKEVRLSMLNGEKHKACGTCWHREYYSKGKISVRVRVNHRWKDRFNIDMAKKMTEPDGTISTDNIKSIELRFGNHCNLKCVMCHPGHSDFWYDDWKQLSQKNTFWTDDGSDENSFLFGGVYYDMNDVSPFHWYKTEKFKEDFLKIYKNLQEVYWAGGEPLLCKEHFDILQALIKVDVAKNIQMRYDSNITYMPDKLLEYWKEFDYVSVQGSVDDVGIRNDYIRYPSKWSTIEKNLKRLDSFGNKIAHSGTTMSCYNILTFLEFGKWAKKNMSKHFWEVMHFKHVIAPFHLAPRVMPRHVKEKAIEIIDDYLEHDAPGKDTLHYIKVDMFRTYLLTELEFFDEEFYKGFIQHTKNVDEIRPLKFKDCFKELYDMIKGDF